MLKTQLPVTTLSNVIQTSYINDLKNRASDCLHQFHQDYFIEKSFHSFCQQHLGHISLGAKILAFRFFDTKIFKTLKEILIPHAQELYSQRDMMLHPVFYLRFTFPDLPQSPQYKTAFLDSQPHFDRSFGLFAYTFWIPLVAINEQTGGLCYFNDPDVIKEFSRGAQNRYSTDGYYARAAEVDGLLRPATVQPQAAIGDVLTFHSDVLHGATKPQSEWRISIDIRLVAREEVERCIDNRTKRVISAFNENPSLCNAENLLYLGDYRGAARHLNAATEHSPTSLLTLNSLNPRAGDILKAGSAMNWRNEYRWIDIDPIT